MSFQVRKRLATRKLGDLPPERACLNHYLYLVDPEFGFMRIRIQGWPPYEGQMFSRRGRSDQLSHIRGPIASESTCHLSLLLRMSRGHHWSSWLVVDGRCGKTGTGQLGRLLIGQLIPSDEIVERGWRWVDRSLVGPPAGASGG